MNSQNSYNDEIDLLVFFTVLIRRKAVVLSIFFIFVITAAIFTFLEPKLYIVSEIMELPALKINNYFGQIGELGKEIEEGNYDYSISKELQLSGVRNFNLGVTIYEERKRMKVDLIVKEKDLSLAPRILDALFLILKSEYEPKIKAEEGRIENEISRLQNKTSEIKPAKKKTNSKDIKLNEREIEIENNLNRIRQLEAEKQSIGNFTLLQAPASLPYQTKIGKIRRITAAAMLGLISGVLLALILEFYQKVKTIKG